MKKLQNSAALIFIGCVAILSVVSILGIWNFFSGDVITKSFQTIGLLGGVAIIIIIAGRFTDSKENIVVSPTGESVVVPEAINPIFTVIRHMTVALLVVSIAILSLVGVLAIWEVVSGEVVDKSVSSIGVLVFSSLVVVISCLEREQHKLVHQKISGGVVVLGVIVVWIFLGLVF